MKTQNMIKIKLKDAFINLENIVGFFKKEERYFRTQQPSYNDFMKIYKEFFKIKDDFFNKLENFIEIASDVFKWVAHFGNFEKYLELCNCTYDESLRQFEREQKWINENKKLTKNWEEYSEELFYLIGSIYITIVKNFTNEWSSLYNNLMTVLD